MAAKTGVVGSIKGKRDVCRLSLPGHIGNGGASKASTDHLPELYKRVKKLEKALAERDA